jgi:DNA polymerase-3 subunit beta
LNGVFLHTAGKALRGVATDGHRLAWLDLPLPAEADGAPGVIIPSKVVAILIKLLKRKPPIEAASLRVSDRLIEVSLPNLMLTAKLIDGTFPDYVRIVPQASDNTVTVGTDALGLALARIEALFDPKSKRGMRTVGLHWSNGALHVALTSSDETDDVIDAKTTGTGRFAARLSYLTDVLEGFNSKEVTFDTNGPKSPAIRVTDSNDTAAFAIVMPITW